MATTYADLVDHALYYLGGTADRAQAEPARLAVLAAYRELPARRTWSFLREVRRTTTNAPYSTGTVTYTHSTRTVTLTGGTFPDWAADGYSTLYLGDTPYPVAARPTTTTLTLTAGANPGADVSAESEYTLYTDTYPLPAGTLSIDAAVLNPNGTRLCYRQPADWPLLRRRNDGPGQPSDLAVSGVASPPGSGPALLLWPPPDARYQVDYLARRAPRPLRVDRRDDGTVTAASTTVTGVNTLFTAALVGSLIRVPADPSQPVTGPAGANPWAEERTVTAVASATSLTIDSAFDGTYSGTTYLISDPVDADWDVAGNYLLREVERQCRLVRRMEPTPLEDQHYQRALVDAKAADSRYTGRTAAGEGYAGPYRLSDHATRADVTEE